MSGNRLMLTKSTKSEARPSQRSAAKEGQAHVVAASNPKSKMKPGMKGNVISPDKNVDIPFDPKMVVAREVVDELLLVCGVIGTMTGEGDELVPVTDCLNWLQDLQRALRRDDDAYRPISLLIGKWKVVEQKLLPLVLTCRYDNAIVLTVVKILVILTKPLAESTKRSARVIIDPSNKTDSSLLRQQIHLRENALEQAQLLLDYKRLIAHHVSHHSRGPGTGLLSIFVSLLADPLSRSGASRTDTDHLTIELVFHLFRNLLSAEPLLNTSLDTSRQANQLHQELISLFEKEHVLEIILVLGQEMEARENAQYNLIMMELLHHLLRTQDPAAVATSHLANTNHCVPLKKSSILAANLKQEKKQIRSIATARHGHFGGTWMKQRGDGNTAFVSAAKHQRFNQDEVSAKRKNRKAEPFIGSGKALLAYSRKVHIEEGPATRQANQSLNNFCLRFISDCYGPVMKSLKNEFRRDSHRLEATDKVIFFRVVWFFSQWWRLVRTDRSIGQLIFTMDVFTFNLVLTATDTFFQHKHYTRMAQAVALYSEMMNLLLDMYRSNDETEVVMARGLLDRLFYGIEPLDRLPRLLSRWTPGVFTREYLCDLLELCHVSLELLESNQQDCQKILECNSISKNDRIAKMITTAAQFEVKGFFCRKVVSNQLISMCTYLLGQYKLNSANVNRRILAMFLRISQTHIATPDKRVAGDPINPLSGRLVTLEPMLFNIHLLMVAGRILSDPSFSSDEIDFLEVVEFSTKLYARFLEEAESNPLLFVECLFRHPVPHRFCDLFLNNYVSEELRMVAERQILLEENQEYNDEIGEALVSQGDNKDDDQSENEFDVCTEEPEVMLEATSFHSSNSFPMDGIAPKRTHDKVASDLNASKKLKHDSFANQQAVDSNMSPMIDLQSTHGWAVVD